MFTSADGSPINAGNIRISDAWLKDATMIAKIYNEKTGTYDYPVNLDGNAVNKQLLGMDDSVQIGKGDYEGSSYDFILFLNNPPLHRISNLPKKRAICIPIRQPHYLTAEMR